MPRAKETARHTAKTTAGTSGKRKRQTAKAALAPGGVVGIEDSLGRLQVGGVLADAATAAAVARAHACCTCHWTQVSAPADFKAHACCPPVNAYVHPEESTKPVGQEVRRRLAPLL
jgi:hypothetical protein